MTVFEATSVYLSGGASKNHPRLTYGVHLDPDNSIGLATGEELDTLDGTVTLRVDTEAAPPIRADAIGLIQYHRAMVGDDYSFAASYSIDIWVPRAAFDELVFAARHGRLPSRMMFEIEGLTFGAAPDGSQMEWDNKTAHFLKVTSFEFDLPLYLSVPTDESQRRLPSEEGMPATRKQFEQLIQRIDRLTLGTVAGLKMVFWAVLIIGATFLLLRLFRA